MKQTILLMTMMVAAFWPISAQAEPPCDLLSEALPENCQTIPAPAEKAAVPKYRLEWPGTDGMAENADKYGRLGELVNAEKQKRLKSENQTTLKAERVLISEYQTGSRSPYPRVEVIWSNGTITRRPAKNSEIVLWDEARARDPGLQILNITGKTPLQAETPQDELPPFQLTRKAPETNPSHVIIEDMLDIHPDHRGKDGQRCTETRDPDGSVQRHCSQTFTWSSSD